MDAPTEAASEESPSPGESRTHPRACTRARAPAGPAEGGRPAARRTRGTGPRACLGSARPSRGARPGPSLGAPRRPRRVRACAGRCVGGLGGVGWGSKLGRGLAGCEETDGWTAWGMARAWQRNPGAQQALCEASHFVSLFVIYCFCYARRQGYFAGKDEKQTPSLVRERRGSSADLSAHRLQPDLGDTILYYTIL